MNDDVIFERNAEAWLEFGPEEAPKRVVDAVLLAIGSMPQQRGLRLPWRFPRLTRQARFATAVAIGVVTIAAGVLLVRQPQPQIGGPSPSPTPLGPSPSPVSSAAIQGIWASVGDRLWPGVLNQMSTFTLGPTVLGVQQPHLDVDSTWSLIDGGTRLSLNFQATFKEFDPAPSAQRWDCQVGDQGVYSVSLASDGERLTLTAVSDACAERAAILAGDWSRWPCAWGCQAFTELSSGRHVSPIFNPFAGATSGQFSYTVPTGWSKLSAPPTWPEVEQETRVTLERRAAPDEPAIGVFSRVAIESSAVVPGSQPETCAATAPGADDSPALVADWLATLDGLNVTTPTPVTIGGLSGVLVDLSVDSGWTNQCEYSQEDGGPPVSDGPRRLFHDPVYAIDEWQSVTGDDRARYILLDRGDGQILVITVQAQGMPKWQALLAEAMPVIESFEFDRGATPPASISPS